MAASNKNELPLNSATEADIQSSGEAATWADGTAEPRSSDPVPTSDDATRDAEDPSFTGSLIPEPALASNEEGSEAIAAGSDGNGIDGEYTGSFGAAAAVPGEFRVPLSALGEWSYHPRFGSRQLGEHFAALALTAAEPDNLRPLVVLPPVDGVHPIFDGRFLYFALKRTHAGNEDVQVRCVLYFGTEAQAVEAVCDSAVGTIDASAMEKAQALHNLQRVNGISQRAIRDRYPRLKKDKISNMLIAARMREAYPVLYSLLIDPDQAPISFGNDILTLKKSMSAEAFQDILDRAEDIATNGERFKPGDVFDALQVEMGQEAPEAKVQVARPKPIVPVASEPLFGDDDAPVAAYERLADNFDRIRLPDVSAMSLAEREAAAEACIAQVRRHFGLDQQG